METEVFTDKEETDSSAEVILGTVVRTVTVGADVGLSRRLSIIRQPPALSQVKENR